MQSKKSRGITTFRKKSLVSLSHFISATIIALFALATSTVADAKTPSKASMPHLDLEMSGAEYEIALKKAGLLGIEDDSDIGTSIELGTKNLAWLKEINSFRAEDKQLQLTSSATQVGYPIETPLSYGPARISQELAALLQELPPEIKDVLTATTSESYPQNPPISDEEFVKWAKRVNKNYERAARWKLLSKYKDSLAERQKQDVRGYYYLEKLENREAILKDLNLQDIDIQLKVTTWLENLCSNASTLDLSGEDDAATLLSCTTKLKNAITAKSDLNPFYQEYFVFGKRNYNSFFNIVNARTDLSWKSKDPSISTLPFQDPKDANIESFLKVNIEDEWKWDSWNLRLDFKNPFALVNIVFKPGAVPSVNDLGGDVITMDKNVAISEYNVKWTIRHEFGHVLGFPDCYIEFYEANKDEMTSYQIDVNHLMCSRVGKFNADMFAQMKKAYLK